MHHHQPGRRIANIESARRTTGSSARWMGHGTAKTTTYSEKGRLEFAKFHVPTGAAQLAHDAPLCANGREDRYQAIIGDLRQLPTRLRRPGLSRPFWFRTG